MPLQDPPPAANPDRAALWRRYVRLMAWMVAIAIVAALLALLYLYVSGTTLSAHIVIATIAGVGLSVLLGTALMGLVFLSNASGHDEAATGREKQDDRD
jgi:hypothetical protein